MIQHTDHLSSLIPLNIFQRNTLLPVRIVCARRLSLLQLCSDFAGRFVDLQDDLSHSANEL